MPPFHSRSTGALRIAFISSFGRHLRRRRRRCPARACTSGVSGIDLGAARVDAAAGADQRLVVVVPARTRQRNMRSRSMKLRAESGFGSRKMWRWSNAASRRMCLRQQHAVAEHVAGHVADADAGEVLRSGNRVPSARKWRLTDSQRALGGDAHALVVVADRAARGERVAQPEAVLRPRCRWRCRRRSRCPCRRRPPGTGSSPSWRTTSAGVHDFAVDEVVGDVEQAVDEALVAGDALGQHAHRGRRRPAGA